MEQAGKRQQAKNPGNIERAQEQTWCQASEVTERGFYQGSNKKPKQQQKTAVWDLFQHLELLIWKD